MGLQREAEVDVVFHGYIHAPLNLEGVEPITTDLTRALSLHPHGRKILLLESASFTPHTARVISERQERMGIARNNHEAFLTSRLHRLPTRQELEQHIQRIESYDLATLINRRGEVLGEQSIQGHFLHQAIDNIRQDNNFEIRYESHTEDLVRRARELRQVILSLDEKMTKSWDEGNFSVALDAAKRVIPIRNSYGIIRDKDTDNTLDIEIKKMLRENGGVIFILFGVLHDYLIDILEKRYRRNLGVKLTQHIPVADSPEVRLSLDVRNKKAVTENMYAQYLLTHIYYGLVGRYFLEANKVAAYATNFETIRRAYEAVSETLSFNEIKKMCEEYEDLLGLLKNHPLAESIHELLV